MAKDGVDAAVHGLPVKVPESCTHRLPLVGAEGYLAARNQRHDLAAASGLHVARIEHLLGRYGSLSNELLDLVRERPELGEPMPGAESYLKVEIYYAARAEGALHLEDILTRRTRISIETEDRGLESARHAAELVAPVLGWDAEAIDREVEHYHARVAAERQSQQEPDDQTADAARLGAPDVRTSEVRAAGLRSVA
jgi:glycerol-3-phosphate dehydrogenase